MAARWSSENVVVEFRDRETGPWAPGKGNRPSSNVIFNQRGTRLQVKWNKKNQHCLSSSHDGDVRIWDKRKSNTAVEYVASHLSKIHGLDWHPDNKFILPTSSQDNSVWFWDYHQPRKYLNILSSQVPVWKAWYTRPVTVMVLQLRRENSLLLLSVFDLNAPIHTFAQ